MIRRPWDILQFSHNEWIECIHQNWDFRAQSSKSYQRWHHFPASSFSCRFQKQPHYIFFFSCHLTEITWGLIIFLRWKPYAISCSCIRLRSIRWNRSIKSCGKGRDGKAWPGVSALIYWQCNPKYQTNIKIHLPTRNRAEKVLSVSP